MVCKHAVLHVLKLPDQAAQSASCLFTLCCPHVVCKPRLAKRRRRYPRCSCRCMPRRISRQWPWARPRSTIWTLGKGRGVVLCAICKRYKCMVRGLGVACCVMHPNALAGLPGWCVIYGYLHVPGPGGWLTYMLPLSLSLSFPCVCSITIAFCKRNEVPIEKIFNKSLMAKFAWAMESEPEFRF